MLQGYVGEYELRPDFTLTVTRSGGRLYMKATGQPMFEYLAASPAEFFRTAGDIRIAFFKDASGAVTGLVLYQDGFDREAKKIK